MRISSGNHWWWIRGVKEACGKGKLDPHRSFLIGLIDQNGDMTMPELAGALADATGVQAHPDAIGRFLRKLGFTYKKRRWSRPSDAAQG